MKGTYPSIVPIFSQETKHHLERKALSSFLVRPNFSSCFIVYACLYTQLLVLTGQMEGGR
jgi:hypothetical protein